MRIWKSSGNRRITGFLTAMGKLLLLGVRVLIFLVREVDLDALRQVKKKGMAELDELDHKKVEYETFNKNFYDEHEEIKNLTEAQVATLKADFEVKTIGSMVPRPGVAFGHLNIDEAMIAKFAKQGYEKPTPIQATALPCVLSGRDVIGIAKTGSGKTLAYVLPLIIHILDQRELKKKEGPVGVILCPTRELSQQVYLEAKRYARIYNITVAALLGGENKHDQWKELRAGVEILVATPGRLIDMYRKKA
jgi:ATP-dependent RNA helicase DDX42